MTVLWFMLFPCVIGLSVVSKTDFTENPPLRHAIKQGENNEDFDPSLDRSKNSSKIRSHDSYIPVYIKRNENKIEARIPVIFGNKTEALRSHRRKSSHNGRNVPVIRGAAVPLRTDLQDLPSELIEGLNPPSQTALESWQVSQQQVAKYPDSNGYYPIVGDGDGYTSTPRPYYGPPSSPRPTYGVPSEGPPSQWGCSSNQWGQDNYQHGRPNYGNRPVENDRYPGNEYPSSGYPPTRYPPSSGYPPTQSYPPPNQYPPSQNYPHDYPQSHYPSNNYPQHSGSPSQGNYPPQSPGAQSSPWRYSGRPWGKQGDQNSQWIPCRPFDLTDTNGRRMSSSGCPQNIRSSNSVRFEPDVTPATQIDGKNDFQPGVPKDVEMIK